MTFLRRRWFNNYTGQTPSGPALNDLEGRIASAFGGETGTFASLTGPNTWTGTQDFSGATVKITSIDGGAAS